MLVRDIAEETRAFAHAFLKFPGELLELELGHAQRKQACTGQRDVDADRRSARDIVPSHFVANASHEVLGRSARIKADEHHGSVRHLLVRSEDVPLDISAELGIGDGRWGRAS